MGVLAIIFFPLTISGYRTEAPQTIEPPKAVFSLDPSKPPEPPPQKLAINEIIGKYSWDDTALKVMKAESGGNAQAYNDEWHYDIYGNKICQGSFGLFQLACLHGKKEDLLDPVKNIEIAYNLYKEEGWKPWGVCVSGIVNCF